MDSLHHLLLSALQKRSFTTSQLRIKTRCGVMKRKARLDRRIRPRNTIDRKVRTLKKLIPNCESMEAERLFEETADYIVALQMRVKLMQIMVDVLSGCDDDDEDEDEDEDE